MRVRISFTVLLFCFASLCLSQNYSIRAFSRDQGLNDPYVYALEQDKEGFLWIATGKGLVSFDGQFFKEEKPGLQEGDLVSAMKRAPDTKLLLGSFTGKLLTTSGRSQAVETRPEKISGSVRNVFFDGEKVFVQSKGAGIYLCRGNAQPQLISGEEYILNDAALTADHRFLLGTSEGLFLQDARAGSAAVKLEGFGAEVTAIQPLLKKNSFAVSISGQGIVEVTLTEAKATIVRKLWDPANVGSANPVSFFYDEQEDVLFAGTADEKLLLLRTKDQAVLHPDQDNFSGAASSFFKDTEGNVWVGTSGKGLYRLTKTPLALLHPELGPVYAISGTNSGTRFYGTNKGLAISESTKAQTKNFETISGKRTGKINALYFDGSSLWIGTEANGLLVAEPLGFKLRQPEFSAIPNISINAITGSSDRISVCTNLDGVYNYRGTVLQEHFSVQNSLLHNNVYYALTSKLGKTFYATHNTSFNYSQAGQLYEIDTKVLGLSSDFDCFAEGSDGRIFIGTNGDGVYELRDTSIRPCSFNDQLDSKFCEGLLSDKSGNLWVVQRYRLYKYHTRENVLQEIKLPPGGDLMFQSTSVYEDKSGDLYFGTNKGVLHVKNHAQKNKSAIPYLVNVTLSDSSLSSFEKKHLGSGSYKLVFEFSALGLANSEDVTFSYLLEGRDEHWSAPGPARKVEYTKLSEGEYAFKVIAYNSEGFSSAETTLYQFSVAAPVWKRPVFWILVCVALAVLMFTMLRLRTAKLIREKEKLESLVDKKTKELREEKALVEQSKIRIEHQNQEIRDSILYASRIQTAMLPDKELIAGKDKNLFVLYLPRDVVSGDFYWMAEIGGLRIFAAADCTGHGVPGALMSMIGSTLLNKIVLEKKITQPKEILHALDEEVKQALRQHTEEATRDGMDLCLCCLDERSGKLIYAGAMRPLFFVRDHKLSELEPAKHAIGGFSYGMQKQFTQAEIAVQPNDMFYLFSDGYADQFGGEKGKKLMLKNFKKILSSISEMEPQKQEENLRRVYMNWKGELEQVDDVLVIGLRIAAPAS